jgi:hypothetical protein
MESLYHAYQAYEKRAERGEFLPKSKENSPSTHRALRARLGDLLIRTGLKLQGRDCAGKPMAWSPMTGSKP